MSTPTSKIKFSQYHKPALAVGDYRVTVTQQVTDTALPDKDKKIKGENTYSAIKIFFVSGERFHINPGEIGGVFPPAHSVSEHSHVFPHIIIMPNTLPWERKVHAEDSITTPWLALLVIYEKEEGDVENTVETLQKYKAKLNITTLEPGQSDNDNIALLHIKKSLLKKLLPGKKELEYLAHVRQGVDDKDNVTGADMAVLMANRLPQKNGRSTVYLVSLENRYLKDQGDFDYQNVKEDDKISLVKLYSWSFNCTNYFKVSQASLDKTDQDKNLTSVIKEKLKSLVGKEFFTEKDFIESLKTILTKEELTKDNQKTIAEHFSFGDFANILKHLDSKTSTLRLPDVNNPATDKYLKMGFYPLPHKLRNGGQTVSWYHGPLCTGSRSEDVQKPVPCADALLRYYQEQAMFDVSYASAWELGRLLALQNTHFSTELYKWKRQYVRSNQKFKQHKEHQTFHLHSASRDHTPASLPSSIDKWLKDLSLLKGVPFAYLVADEALLPAESIRFFKLDRDWIHALLDGALSMGRVTRKDHENDKQIIEEEDLLASRIVSGFILRSEVVSGWPGLQIEGYDADDKLMTILRDEKLSANVRLCLFDGNLRRLSLHLKPEMLHFGVNQDDGGKYYKTLRDTNGKENEENKITVPFLSEERVLDVIKLIETINNQNKKNNQVKWVSTSAHLGVQLLQGVECVQWTQYLAS